ncbi:MAG TPA: hypothetical protein VN039_06205, partial [Nitrospira sp.]|nr:hypothetical protein [Nitrospira sp.]
ITLQASELRPQNVLSSIAGAQGGNGSGDPLSKGGEGGKITIININIEPSAIVNSSPGHP